MLVIAWVLDQGVARALFGDSPWFAWERAVTFAVGMPLVLGWRSWLILNFQLLHRHRTRVSYGDTDSPRADKEEEHG